MVPSDQSNADARYVDDPSTDLREASRLPTSLDAESANDEAWLAACRDHLDESQDHSSASAPTVENDLETANQVSDSDHNEASPIDSFGRETAIKKTGDDAMSKFGHAIGALADEDEVFDEQALDHAAEMASPSSQRDAAVAPHIAAAEREIEMAKSSRPLDIFDRIAQAAESQFDEARGSTSKRVNELVDDRRVGTKRWTPSKTMKERMAKLEAARAAATGDTPAPEKTSITNKAATDDRESSVEETAAITEPPVEVKAASAPASSQATMVSPGAKTAAPEKEEASIADDERVVISRRNRQEEANETDAEEAVTDEAAADTEEAVDGLRVIPGARGRRRDRARKSRLDEDFEKIFDDDGKPSITSLRRKLRTSASSEAEEGETEAATTADAEVTGADADSQPKKGLFSRLLQPKAKKSTDVVEQELPVSADADEEDDLVAAFGSADVSVDETTDGDSVEAWETDADLDTQRKQRQIAVPIIAIGAAIALGLTGYFLGKMLGL